MKLDSMDNEDRRVLRDFIATGEIPERFRAEVREADQNLGTAAAGGALASTGFSAALFDVIEDHGGLRATNVTRINTEDGNTLKRPGIDDLHQGVVTGEGSTRTTSVEAVDFFDVSLEGFKFQGGPIAISFESIDDTRVDIGDIVLDKLGTRIARKLNADLASTNTSSTGPAGVLALSSGSVTMNAGSSNLTLTNLRDLFFSLDPAWRDNAEWAVSDEGLDAMLSIEDADGRPLIQPDQQRSFDMRLFGRPIRRVAEFDSFSTAGNKPIALGDWSAYAIRDVSNARMLRLTERYALSGRVGLIGFSRHDGRHLFSSTISSSNVPIKAIKITT